MKPYAEVIGDPIAQSKSPRIHNFWLKKLKIPGDFRAERVTTDGLPDYFNDRRADPNWRGCNVTMPLKQAVAPLVDVIDQFAARAGAINTVVREGNGLRGGNSDGAGFLEPLGDVDLGSAWLIGTGGAARAIAQALGDAGIEVTIFGRSVERARALAALVGGKARALDEIGPAAAPYLLVNATSLGMNGQLPLVLPLTDWPIETVVYDIVTSPVDTLLLQEARARGMRSFDGLEMLIGQAAVAFERFFGEPAPRQHDGELRRLLTS